MKKTLTTALLAFFGCLFIAAGFLISSRAVFAEEVITFEEGASIRIDTATENNTSGIRFTANVPASLADNEVGMIVVPAYILDGVGENYAEYFESRGVALSEISTVFTEAQKKSGKINGAIVGIRDENFNLEYQAVCYYKSGDTYVYSEKSSKRNIAYVADKGYGAIEGETAQELKNEVLRIIGKSVETALNGYMYEGQRLDLAGTLEGLSAGGVTLSAAGALTAEGTVLTANSAGTGSITISGYDGAFSVTKTIKSVPVTEVSLKTQSWQQPEQNMIQLEFNESAFSSGAYVDTSLVEVESNGKKIKVTGITEGNESKLCFYGKFPKTENSIFTFKAGSVFFKENEAYKLTADRSFIWSGAKWWGYNPINWTTADWSPESGVQVVTSGMSDITEEKDVTLNNFVATVNGKAYSGITAHWYPSASKLMFNGLSVAAGSGLGTVLTLKAGSGFTEGRNLYAIAEDKSFVFTGVDGSYWMYLLGEVELNGVGYNTEKRIQIGNVDFSGFTKSNEQFQQYKGIYQNGSEISPNVWYHISAKVLDLGYHGGTGAETGGFSTDYPVEIKAGSVFYEYINEADVKCRNAYRISGDWKAEWDGAKWQEVREKPEIEYTIELNSPNHSEADLLQFATAATTTGIADGTTATDVSGFIVTDENGNAVTGISVTYYENAQRFMISGLGGYTVKILTIKAGAKAIFETADKKIVLKVASDSVISYGGTRWNRFVCEELIISETNKDWSDAGTFQVKLPDYGMGGGNPISLNMIASDLIVTDESGNALTGISVTYHENVGGVAGNNKISISGLGGHTEQALTIKAGSVIRTLSDLYKTELEIVITQDVTIVYDDAEKKWNPVTDSISSNGRFTVFTDLSPSVFIGEEALDKYLAAGFTDFNLTFDAAELASAVDGGKLSLTDNLKNAIAVLNNAGVKIYIRNQTDGGDFFGNIAGEFNEAWAEGVCGFYFNDEPSAEEFAALNALVQFFNDNYAASGKTFHINLFPSYADKTNFGMKKDLGLIKTYYSWEEYVDNYISSVLSGVNGKKTLCIDCYPFGSESKAFEKGTYIKDLSYIANKVKELNGKGQNVVTGICVQAFSEGEEFSLPVSFKEISFQLLTGMAVGAELFEYFGYGNALGGGYGIYGFAGDETAYEAVKTANVKYLPLANILGAYEWQGLSYCKKSGSSAFDGVNNSAVLAAGKTGALSSFTATEDALCGYYSGGFGDGYMITNYSDPKTGGVNDITLNFASGSHVIIYGARGEKSIKSIASGTLTLRIEAGEGFFVAVR